MVGGYSSLARRYPEYRDLMHEQRFQDEIFEDLCRDYDSVLAALEGGKSEPDSTYQELQVLAQKLEHEFLERIATYAARKKKRSHDYEA